MAGPPLTPGFAHGPLAELGLLPRAYAAVLFTEHPGVGLVFLAATLWFPNVGLAGLVAAFTALITARLFDFPYRHSGIHVFNGLLTGLSLGAFYQLNGPLLVLLIVGAAATVFLTVLLAELAWRIGRLPVLSLPFVITALVLAFAAQGYAGLQPYRATAQLPATWFSPWLDPFFVTLGSTFFSPHPAAGALLFAGLLWQSRYIALLAATGFAAGFAVHHGLAEPTTDRFAVWNGFNFVLTAIAVGGVFAVPGLASFALAVAGAAATAVVTAGIQGVFVVFGMPVMAAPFLVTTLIMLFALSRRQHLAPPWLVLEQPGMPEQNWERARLARLRTGEIDSVPLLAPFFGQWQIYQGMQGPHTHRPPWGHALDFFVTRDGVSYDGAGDRVEDYHCFGLPVVSPVHGEVSRVLDRLPDNAPGEVDVQNNWGNFVLIRLDSGLHVLLAHLRQGSIKVREGQPVEPGVELAACGNSGRSPQPHLHLQVQRLAPLGSPTWPFHLTSVVRHEADGAGHYHLVLRPEAGDSVQPARPDPSLVGPLHLPVGRSLFYALTEADGRVVHRELRVELTLLGQFRLTTDRGASAAFEETNGVLAFYDRQGPRDALLDLWLLALGLTPLAVEAQQWDDAPSARLLPLDWRQRPWLALWRPLGAGLRSRYRREQDAEDDGYRQTAEHELHLPGIRWRAHTQAHISAQAGGCTELSLQFGERSWSARLLDTGQIADTGIPAWHRPASVFEPQRQRGPR